MITNPFHNVRVFQSPGGLSDQTVGGGDNGSMVQDDASSVGAKDDEDDDEDDEGLEDGRGGDPEKVKAFNVSTKHPLLVP